LNHFLTQKMDTPLRQNKAISNLLKIQRKHNEDGTPKKDAIHLTNISLIFIFLN